MRSSRRLHKMRGSRLITKRDVRIGSQNANVAFVYQMRRSRETKNAKSCWLHKTQWSRLLTKREGRERQKTRSSRWFTKLEGHVCLPKAKVARDKKRKVCVGFTKCKDRVYLPNAKVVRDMNATFALAHKVRRSHLFTKCKSRERHET